MRVLLGETHMIGKTVIVKGKKGKVVKQVSSDGKTESDEIYQVKFEDGTIEDIPARDMEMQGDISNRKEPSENEAEDIVNEAKYRPTPVSPGSRYPTQAKKPKKNMLLTQIDAHPGIPGMSKKGKGILASMTNSFETGGGPHIYHKNIHNLTHHSVNQTLKKAHKHLEDNPHPEASKQLALVMKELGESVEVNEADKMPGILPYTQAQWAAHKAKELAPEELAISSERLVDTRKNIEKYLKSKKKKKIVKDHVEHFDEATKTEKKTRQVQNRTAAAYAQQKPELEPGPKTAKFNRLANQLDKLRRSNK